MAQTRDYLPTGGRGGVLSEREHEKLRQEINSLADKMSDFLCKLDEPFGTTLGAIQVLFLAYLKIPLVPIEILEEHIVKVRRTIAERKAKGEA